VGKSFIYSEDKKQEKEGIEMSKKRMALTLVVCVIVALILRGGAMISADTQVIRVYKEHLEVIDLTNDKERTKYWPYIQQALSDKNSKNPLLLLSNDSKKRGVE
jgi:hypothetical protein